MGSQFSISRRTALKGLGTAIALPLLDVMTSGRALASAPAAAAPPRRMAFVFMPNGVSIPDWIPTKEGADFDLPFSLEPLAAVKSDVTVLSGLACDNARAKGDGPGDHARSAAAFLTGAHPYKTAGDDIKLGVSVDQLAAQQVGKHTRLPSLELGTDRGQAAGNCDSGYSCAYTNNVSWSSETTPVPKEVDPAAVFDRLFGSADERAAAESRQRRLRLRKSVLDFVNEDARRLNQQLGRNDQRKLDEFTTSIREVERRIEAARGQKAEQAPRPELARPDGIPGALTEHMKLMWDLLALSFQTDVTRVGTFMIACDGSNRSYDFLGVNEGHHSLSHHGRNPEKVAQIKKIDRYHVEQFAYFVQKLKGIREGEGTLLDNCMVMMGSGIGDGDRHNHNDLPVLLAGRGGGTITPGRHVSYPKNTPICNLYLSMLERAGVQAERFGDSSGKLDRLTA